VLFDAVYVPGGAASVATLGDDRDAIEFLTESYRHCKAIAATGEGVDLLRACSGLLIADENGNDASAEGVLVSSDPAGPALIRGFLDAIAEHRFWNRARKNRLGGSPDETRGRAPARPPKDRRASGRRSLK
jgi:catalase